MSRFLPLLLVCALVPACKNKDKDKDTVTPATTPEDEDNSFATDGSDANAADTDAQLVASSLVAASPGTIGLASLDEGALGTQDVGDGVKAIYLPRTCVTGRQTAPGEATYTFDKCIGPNGLLGVSGEIKARFTADTTKLHLDLTYTNMKVNGAKFDGSATAEVTAAGAKRTMTWGATLDGETQHGKPFSYRSTHTVAWSLGEACFALEGTTEGQVRQRDIKTEVQNFRRCRRGCPEDGGKIIVTNVAKNKVVTIEFDGTATATYTAPNGKQLPLALACK
ncbi:MAG: hypothetical protein U0270_32445 [Labilithrix sp.]